VLVSVRRERERHGLNERPGGQCERRVGGKTAGG
jgi:hypothetical protein